MKKIILFSAIFLLYGLGYSVAAQEVWTDALGDFESTTVFESWSQIELGNTKAWTLQEFDNTSPSGSQNVKIQSFGGDKTALVSPTIIIPNDANFNYVLKFSLKVQDVDFLSAEVLVSTTGTGDAATFTEKFTVIKTLDEESEAKPYNTWIEITGISLDAYKGQNINIAFVHTANNSGFSIDAIKIESVEAVKEIADMKTLGDFESTAVFESWSQIELGNTKAWTLQEFDNTSPSGNNNAKIQSFGGDKTALVSPTITIPDDANFNYVLKFSLKVQDVDFLSGEVLVSTTGKGDAATFTEKFTAIKTLDEESEAKPYNTWIEITGISLDAYKGQNINIAFVHTANNSGFSIDAIEIESVAASTGITWTDDLGDFESTTVFESWSQIELGNTKAWTLQEFDNTSPSGSQNVKIQSFNGDKTAFVSPTITIPNKADSNYTLIFWSKVQDLDFLSGEVLVSTTGTGDAATFTEKFTVIKTLDEESEAKPYNTWIEITGISLNAYKGQNINIAFVHTANNSGFSIDAIKIKHVDPVTPKYTVTITEPANGAITVMNGEIPVTSGTEIEEGTQLTLKALQGNNYKLNKWMNNVTTATQVITVNKDTTISATFTELPTVTSLPYNVNFVTSADLNNFATISEGNGAANAIWAITSNSGGTDGQVVASGQAGGPNLNALITSAIVIPENGSFEFAFNTSFGQNTTNLLDSTCRVMISKTVSNDLSAFTEVFDLFSDRGSLNSGNATAEFTIPLADYAGDTIYIAFIKQTKAENSTISTSIVWRIDKFSIRELYTATITTPDNGTITVMNGSTPVNSGDEVGAGTTLTLTATPANDYKFEKWWDNNTNAYRTFTTTGSHTISASFTKVDYITSLPYSITDNTWATEFAKFPTMSKNTTSAWKVAETSVGAEPESTVNVLVSDTVSGAATEAFITPGIVVPANSDFSLAFATSYYYNTNAVGTFPSDSCLVLISTTAGNDLSAFTTKVFNLSSDRVSGEDTLQIDNIGKFNIPLSNYAGDTIYIAFVKKTTESSAARGIEWRIHELSIAKSLYAVTITEPENGTITVKNGETTVNSGDKVEVGTELTLTATPAAEYNFIKWWDNSTESPYAYTVTAAVEISATFEKENVNIEDVNLASKALVIYPNPVVNGKLTVELPKNNGTVHIFDLSGKLVLTLTTNSPKTEINVSNLQKGSYVVKVGAASAKFIKQ
jgi:hypothetical protein